MPVYDINCANCGDSERISTMAGRIAPCDVCGGPVEQVYRPNSRTYGQDEIPGGLWVENLGKDPVKVYSHSERLAIAKANGLEEFVRHVPEPGSSRSKWTTNWDTGPSQDPRPISMLTVEERRERRIEAAARLGVTVEELEAISGPVETMTPGIRGDDEDRTGGEFAERVIQNRFNMVGDAQSTQDIVRALNGE